MADAVVKYAQSVAATTATTTTWVDLASLAATEFEANKTYLILANQVCVHDNQTNHTRVRLVHGTTPTVFDDASCSWEGQGQEVSTQHHEISYMFFYTQPGTAELVKLQISSNTTGSTITNSLSQIIAIKLSDDFTENTHYFKTEDLVNYTLTATPTAKAATGSFTPNGTDRWLFIGNMIEDVVTLVDEIGFELYDSVAGVLGLSWQEAEDTADQRAHTLFWVGVPTNAARTLAIRPVEEAGSNIMLAGRTIALNLTTMFAQSASAFDATQIALGTSPTYSTLATIAPNPTNTGNWVVIAFATFDAPYTTDTAEVQLQINPDGGGLVDNPAFPATTPGTPGWDVLDEVPFSVFNLLSLTSGGARTMNYDFRRTASTLVAEDIGIVAFSVAKASTTYNATATLAGTSSVVTVAKKTNPFTSTLAGTSSAVTVGKNTNPFTSTLAGTSSAITVGKNTNPFTSTLAGTSSVVTVGKKTNPFTSTLAGTSSVVTIGKNTLLFTSTVAATSSLVSVAKKTNPFSATLAATSSVISTAQKTNPFTSTILATSVVVSSASNSLPYTATFGATSNIIVVGSISSIVNFTSTLTGTSSLVTVGRNSFLYTVTLAGTSSFVSVAKNTIPYTSTLTGTSSVVSVGKKTNLFTSTLTGTSSVVAMGKNTILFTSTLSGTSIVVSIGKNTNPFTSTLTSTSSLVVIGQITGLVEFTASLIGTSSLVSDGKNTLPFTSSVLGTSSVVAVGKKTNPYTSILSGTSNLVAVGKKTNPFTSALTGTSNVVTIGRNILAYTSTLTGNSSLVTSAKKTNPFISTLTGTSFLITVGRNTNPFTSTFTGTSSLIVVDDENTYTTILRYWNTREQPTEFSVAQEDIIWNTRDINAIWEDGEL